MQSDKVRVLVQILDLRVGNGIAAFLNNYYKYTIDNGYVIDFIVNKDTDSEFKKRVLSEGSNVYVMPHNTSKPDLKNIRYIRNIIAKGYDILHVNHSGFYALTALKEAKKQRIKVRIYHAHNPMEPRSLKVIIRDFLYVHPSVRSATYYAACSKVAGDSVFQKRPYTVVPNAINTKRFFFDIASRKELRKKLNISDRFVVGTVCRIEDQKNPLKIIEIFYEIHKVHSNTLLLWAGEGSLRKEVDERIRSLGIEDSVIMLGTRTDVDKLYSAMDIFLLPSKYEGLGIVFVEAQASGLECYASDCVPGDVEITTLVHRLPLTDSSEKWAGFIDFEFVSTEERIKRGRAVADTYYEIDNSKTLLADYYNNCLGSK